MQQRKIRFSNREAAAFAEEVKAAAAGYFEATGRSRHADASMVAKTVFMLALVYGSYALLYSGWFSLWGMLGLTVLMGIGIAGVGFCVAHDALHGAYSANPTVNRLLGLSFDALGANGYMWKITHNVIHHTYTNITGVDEDLTVSPLLRLSPEAPRYGFHRFQHVYGWLAYGLATINWLFAKDFQQFLKRDIGPYKDKRHPRGEVIWLIASKLFVVAWMIALPLALLDVTWWQFGLGFLAMHVTAGMILGIVFQLAHVVEGPEFLQPDDEGRMEHAWLVHEMHTTANFAAGNTLFSWYIGGLNYQIEHHLFPQVCSIHYPKLAPIVRDVAARHGIPYHYQPTLRAAVRSHYTMLRKLGQPEPSPTPAYA